MQEVEQDARNKVCKKQSRMHEIFYARMEKNARNIYCWNWSQMQEIFYAKNEKNARNIYCQKWKHVQEIFIARNGTVCTKYCMYMQDINIVMYGNIAMEIACKK